MARLKKGDITIRELYELSNAVYKNPKFDNKRARVKMDILSARTVIRNNLEKDKEGNWQQTGRSVKVIGQVRSDPTSYIKSDSISPHIYPVTFLIYDIKKGIDSPFKFRTGSEMKVREITKKISECKTKKEKDAQRKKNKAIRDLNISLGIQQQFRFELEQVLQVKGLLYGRNMSNRKMPSTSPKSRTNPYWIIFFDKHSLAFLERALFRLFNKINRQ